MYTIIETYENNDSYQNILNIERCAIKHIMNKAYSLNGDFRTTYLKGTAHLLEELQEVYESYASSIMYSFTDNNNEITNLEMAKEYSFNRECAFSVNRVLRYVGTLGDFNVKPVKDLLSLFQLQCPNAENEHDVKRYETCSTPKAKTNREKYVKKGVITGFRNLHHYTGININKLQKIMNTGILKEMGISYMSGGVHKILRDKLDKLLEEQPDFFA